MPIVISNRLVLADEEIELSAIRSQGKGGQNVNKVSSAIHLRFDIRQSSLPEVYKERLLALSDQRINKDGCVVIKSQEYRTQEKNREAAVARLIGLIKQVMTVQKRRIATKPSKNSQKRRMDKKTQRGKIKANRGRVDY
ncbi:alternative ribosome rescue aminoacyl-tRNA hydrolase ArfB [Maricurvus nonylphenolicus]|uniref:alternative ribosome rescue aminoacyl-tRNA hydrolase ArfB n=1 Tax=Maricurvus nonylphenolicus TaxID=1008307 RepID=UPI0036F2089E